jgi:hypothetical protein
MLTGIIMELTIGPMLVGKLGFGVYLFAQVMAATINFGCFFAANLITLPLYTVGLFKVSLCWTTFWLYMCILKSHTGTTFKDGISRSHGSYSWPNPLTGLLLQ